VLVFHVIANFQKGIFISLVTYGL